MEEVLLMPIDVPKASKVYTTTYENFKGVDFTNDPSNVWYRRSPDAVNMMPDESGRPFKRTGWEIAVSAANMTALYASDTGLTAPSEIDVRKCYYFELSGEDHIFIFTNYAVFIYRNGQLYSSKNINPTTISYSANYQSLTDAQKEEYDLAYASYNSALIESYERAFFFEGGGKAGFYVYGGFKIWEYAYNDTDGFTWKEVEPYIPSVNIGVDARHEAGTSHEYINMFSDFIAEEFENNTYLSVTSYNTGTITPTSVDDTQFIAMVGTDGTYTFTYTDADHSWLLGGDQVMISNYGITISTSPTNNDTIIVVLGKATRINLPKRILSADGMKVYVSSSYQFDTKLNLQDQTETSQTTNDCTLKTPIGAGNSYIKFYADWRPLVDGEDAIKVIYPRNEVTPTVHDVAEFTINVGA